MHYDKYLICFAAIFLTALFPSCKKYLDEKPDKSLVVLTTVDDLQALLDLNDRINTNTPGFGETSSDDYFILPGVYNGMNEADRRAYSWRLEDYTYQNDWAYAYLALYPINYCLENISEIDKTERNKNEWDNVKGSALFYRAYWFLSLVWVYSKAYDDNTSKDDLGVVLRTTTDINKPSVRSSVEKCYERIVNDAKESAKYLPDFSQHVMRPSKAAAYGLLARTYWSMRKYDSAFKYADLMLALKHDLLDYDGPQVDTSSLVPFPSFNKEIVYYSAMSFYYASKTPTNAFIDTVLYESYSDNDMRKYAFFSEMNGYHSFKGNYNSINRYSFFSGIATDEIYLIKAECLAREGNVKEAMSIINTLLESRWKKGTFIPLTAEDKTQALDIILKERRKELLMRGLRWIDIKRLNMESRNISLKRVIGDQVFTLPPNDNRFALPLPNDVIELTGMKQNPF